jgi:hypothetical protein
MGMRLGRRKPRTIPFDEKQRVLLVVLGRHALSGQNDDAPRERVPYLDRSPVFPLVENMPALGSS